jgi:hypothetical protein
MSLLLHCGAQPKTRDEIALVPTPAPLGRFHNPYPYIDLIEQVTDSLRHIGMTIREESFGVLGEGKRFFGLMTLAPVAGQTPEGFGFEVALRASHDQTFPTGLVAGKHTFCCDNLAFSGEINISTRQTIHVMDRLPGLILNAVQKLPGVFEVLVNRQHAYGEFGLEPRWGDAAITEMVRRQILTPTQVGRAIQEWDEPSHDEHLEQGRTVLTLENAVTEAIKAPVDPETGLATRPGAPVAMERTIRLTKFLDEIVGFDAGVVEAN